MTQLSLNADDIELSHIHKEDTSVLLQIINDNETCRYLHSLYKLLNEENGISIFIESFDKYHEEGSGFLWGIRQNNSLIGFIALMDIPIKPFIFYAMHPIFRRRGYMKKCLSKVVNTCISQFSLPFIMTYVLPDNVISIHLLTSVCFQFDGYNAEGMEIYKYQ